MTSGLVWRGAAVTAAVEAKADRALDDAAEYLLEESNRTIPHQTGNMEQSGATHRLSALSRAVTYDTPYCVRQHEDTRNRHATGRRARWLALTLQEQEQRIMRFLQDGIKDALR